MAYAGSGAGCGGAGAIADPGLKRSSSGFAPGGGPMAPGVPPEDLPTEKRARNGDMPLGHFATGPLHPGPPQLHPQLHPLQPQEMMAPMASARMVPKVMYRAETILGRGSFGVVYKATVVHSGASVAIKAVRQRMGDLNLEDQILRKLRGSPNIVALLGTFCTGHMADHTLHLVLEFMADTLQRIIKHHRVSAMWMDMHYVRLYMYQLLRGLACLERWGVVHRDIKPANLLVDPATKTLKVCDFGTAKLLHSATADNQPYVCSRYYRAPELVLSAPEYGTAVDLWSGGCVLAEMLVGQVLFTGKDGVDQLAQIVDIIGTPSAAEFYAMNPTYDASVGFRARVEPVPWERVLRRKVGPEATELLGRLLQYDPSARPRPLECMAGPLFDDLRLLAGQIDPSLFELLPEELNACGEPAVRDRLAAAAKAAAQSRSKPLWRGGGAAAGVSMPFYPAGHAVA